MNVPNCTNANYSKNNQKQAFGNVVVIFSEEASRLCGAFTKPTNSEYTLAIQKNIKVPLGKGMRDLVLDVNASKETPGFIKMVAHALGANPNDKSVKTMGTPFEIFCVNFQERLNSFVEMLR